MNRIGILGGRFDPPHIAPLIHATLIMETFNLGKVMFVPAARPPHKKAAASFQDRLEMTRLAADEEQGLEVTDIEQKEGLSYTVDTLNILKQRLPDTRIFLIIGRDEYECWNQWKQPQEILRMAELVVMPRGERSGSAPGKGVHFPDLPLLEISATRIRERIREGKSVKHWVPPRVLGYIKSRNLYQGGEGNG